MKVKALKKWKAQRPLRFKCGACQKLNVWLAKEIVRTLGLVLTLRPRAHLSRCDTIIHKCCTVKFPMYFLGHETFVVPIVYKRGKFYNFILK